MGVKTLDDLKKLEGVLVVRSAYTEALLRANGFRNLEVANNPVNMVHMLMASRRPVAAIDAPQMAGALRQAGVDSSAVEKVFGRGSTTAYFFFSKEIPEGTVARWQLGLDNMKKEGVLLKLYAKWFPSGPL